MTNEISVKDVSVSFHTKSGVVEAVKDVSIDFKSDIVTGILGESGSGKSVLAMAILNLLPNYASVDGEILVGDKRVVKGRKMPKDFYGKTISTIPQSPSQSLNPSLKIKAMFKEVIRYNLGSNVNFTKIATELLDWFGFGKNTYRVMNSYHFELSGGMQQRVLCALALASNPRWIIADEPSKGLDSDLKYRVIENLNLIKKRGDTGLIIITHDIELALELCDRIAIMYEGKIVEIGGSVLQNPKHDYTKSFIMSMPRNGFQII